MEKKKFIIEVECKENQLYHVLAGLLQGVLNSETHLNHIFNWPSAKVKTKEPKPPAKRKRRQDYRPKGNVG